MLIRVAGLRFARGENVQMRRQRSANLWRGRNAAKRLNSFARSLSVRSQRQFIGQLTDCQ